MIFVDKQYTLKMFCLIILPLFTTFSCTVVNEQFDVPVDESESAESDTYVNFNLSLESRNSLTVADPEEKIHGIYFLIFNESNKLERKAYFTVGDLTPVAPTATAPLSYKLKKPMMLSAGKKRVYAIANPNSTLTGKLDDMQLKEDRSVLRDMQVEFLPSTTTLANRTNVDKQGYRPYGGLTQFQTFYTRNYNNSMEQPDNFGFSYQSYGYDFNRFPGSTATGAPQISSTGLLMSGENTVELEAGVSETEALAEEKNLVTIGVTRLVAKVSISMNTTNTEDNLFDIYDGPLSDRAVGNNTYPVTPIYFVANRPRSEYLIERGVTPYTHTPANEYGNHFSNACHGFHSFAPKTNYNNRNNLTPYLYLPENIVSIPRRGNASYLWVGIPFTPKAGTVTQWHVRSGTTWQEQSRTFPNGHELCEITDVTNTTPVNNKVYVKMGRGENLGEYLKWALFMPDKTPTNVIHVNMSMNDYTRAMQEAALGQRLGTLQNGDHVVFYYKATDVASGHYYDYAQVFQYRITGSGGNLSRSRTLVKEYRVVRYSNLAENLDNSNAQHEIYYSYYSIYLENQDPSVVGTIEQYAVHRNNHFDVKVNRILQLGFPDPHDPMLDPADEIRSSWIEIKISIEPWEKSTNQDETIDGRPRK